MTSFGHVLRLELCEVDQSVFLGSGPSGFRNVSLMSDTLSLCLTHIRTLAQLSLWGLPICFLLFYIQLPKANQFMLKFNSYLIL